MSNATVSAPAVEATSPDLRHRLGRSRRAFARRHHVLASALQQAAKETRSAAADYVRFVAGEGLRWRRFAERRREALRTAALERAVLVQLHQVLAGAQHRVLRRVAELDRPTLGGGEQGDGVPEEPWTGYESLSAREVVSALADADEQTCREVEAHELAHKNRVTVLRAARRRLAR